MLHSISLPYDVFAMPIGTSGRIVIEIDPDLKQELYSALEAEGLNLKQWFLERVDSFLEHRGQMSLPLGNDADLPEGPLEARIRR